MCWDSFGEFFAENVLENIHEKYPWEIFSVTIQLEITDLGMLK